MLLDLRLGVTGMSAENSFYRSGELAELAGVVPMPCATTMMNKRRDHVMWL
jgi:hypothetical protein